MTMEISNTTENLVDFKSVLMRIRSDIKLYKDLRVKLYLSEEFMELEFLVESAIG